MKYRKVLVASVFVFALLSSVSIVVIVYSQSGRPRENRGEPRCTTQAESSGAITAFLDCVNWGSAPSEGCTPSQPWQQSRTVYERFPTGRQNCRFTDRNGCGSSTSAGFSWQCDDGQVPSELTETTSIVCPVSCYKYCPNPPPNSTRPCNRATWDSTYCNWNISRCRDVGETFCTTPGWDGSCPEGTSPNGNGMCCSSGTCNNSGAYNFCSRNFFEWFDDSCSCSGGCLEGGGCSPIVVDVLGNGFSMTNAGNGISFDMNSFGSPLQISWTAPGSDDAWLALDRNQNGTVDSGEELFGNMTEQPVPPSGQEANGFLALGEYDKLHNGGNGDGKITRLDAIFDRLKLWQDTNHNGISESCELFSLPELGLRKLDLDYRESQRMDAHGNQFKFRARVRDSQDAHLGRWAWDVFLVVQQP
jgi:hypothetical protein